MVSFRSFFITAALAWSVAAALPQSEQNGSRNEFELIGTGAQLQPFLDISSDAVQSDADASLTPDSTEAAIVDLRARNPIDNFALTAHTETSTNALLVPGTTLTSTSPSVTALADSTTTPSTTVQTTPTTTPSTLVPASGKAQPQTAHQETSDSSLIVPTTPATTAQQTTPTSAQALTVFIPTSSDTPSPSTQATAGTTDGAHALIPHTEYSDSVLVTPSTASPAPSTNNAPSTPNTVYVNAAPTTNNAPPSTNNAGPSPTNAGPSPTNTSPAPNNGSPAPSAYNAYQTQSNGNSAPAGSTQAAGSNQPPAAYNGGSSVAAGSGNGYLVSASALALPPQTTAAPVYYSSHAGAAGVVAGAAPVTIGGTTYSLAVGGSALYVNGVSKSLAVPSLTTSGTITPLFAMTGNAVWNPASASASLASSGAAVISRVSSSTPSLSSSVHASSTLATSKAGTAAPSPTPGVQAGAGTRHGPVLSAFGVAMVAWIALV